MYASSFVGALRRVDESLNSALSLQTFEDERSALAIADEAASILDDIGELASVALPKAGNEGLSRRSGDEAVAVILRTQFEEGVGRLPNGETVDTAIDAGRINRVEESVIVPISAEMPGIRNWWLLVGLAIEWLDDIHEGFVRTYQRAVVNGSETVETAYWTVVDRLEALQEALSFTRMISQYVYRSLRRGRVTDTTDLSNYATAITR